jgi:hypothetical protein
MDIETNGLQRHVSKVHLLLIRDLDTDEEWVFRNKDDTHLHNPYYEFADEDPGVIAPFVGYIEDGLKMLAEAGLLVGHNIIDYDIPVLETLYPGFTINGRIRDTLVLARLIFSDIKENDFVLARKGKLPPKLIGSQGLKAWGYRLGEHKGDYGGAEDAWAVWNIDMENYGRQDTVTGKFLWLYLCRQIAKMAYSQDAIILEHRFADLVAKIEDNGFPFREDDAKVLYGLLNERRKKIALSLSEQFRPWWTAEKWVERNGKSLKWREGVASTPARTISYKDPLKASRVAGAPFTPVKRVEFNPASRDQIADRLMRLFGWEPKVFTETGKPKVSEDILRDLVGEFDVEEDGMEEAEDVLYERLLRTVPQAKNLADFFLVQKRIGQLAEGKNGWLKLVHNGKVHGSVNSLGAVTRRVTHARPNMSQCPAIRSPYGVEMRGLFHVPKGWLQFGTDLSGIEIRCFANVLSEFDEGVYADIVINGDIHSENQRIFGVPTRDNAKTTLYALLYGAGDAKIGSIVGKGAEEGRRIKQNFMRGVPAYKKVVNRLNSLVERQGWIPALDGGRLSVRSSHKALNTSLQSAGALVAKQWACGIEDSLIDSGWNHGWDGDFVILGFFHDELQVAVRAPQVDTNYYVNPTDYRTWDDEKKVAKDKKRHLQDWFYNQSPEIRHITATAKSTIKDVEKHFNFVCPLDCEYIVGLNWADCH